MSYSALYKTNTAIIYITKREKDLQMNNTNLKLITENDECFGNDWRTTLIFEKGDNLTFEKQRPQQYFGGVHGLVNLYKDEFHLLTEDDGNFQTFMILSKEEIIQLHKEMKNLVNEFRFLGDCKVKYKNQNILKNRKSGNNRLSSLRIEDREISAPLLYIGIKDETLCFDVNFLPDLVKVLDI